MKVCTVLENHLERSHYANFSEDFQTLWFYLLPIRFLHIMRLIMILTFEGTQGIESVWISSFEWSHRIESIGISAFKRSDRIEAIGMLALKRVTHRIKAIWILTLKRAHGVEPVGSIAVVDGGEKVVGEILVVWVLGIPSFSIFVCG